MKTPLKTTAKLVASPYQIAIGEWRAAVFVKGERGLEYARVTQAHEDLKPGDTITVERHGSEWRAV